MSGDAGWSDLVIGPLARADCDAWGAGDIERLFEALCAALPVWLARSSDGGGRGLVEDWELAGDVDWIDWLQYYSTRFAPRLRLKRAEGVARIECRPLGERGWMLRICPSPFEGLAAARADAAGILAIDLASRRMFVMRSTSSAAATVEERGGEGVPRADGEQRPPHGGSAA